MADYKPGFWARAAYNTKMRFKRVWGDKYPRYWHLIDAIVGLVVALIFVFLYEPDAPVWTRVLWFFAVWGLTYLIAFAATYGVVRARNFGPKRS